MITLEQKVRLHSEVLDNKTGLDLLNKGVITMKKLIVMRLLVPWFSGRIPTLLLLVLLILLAMTHVASSATFTVNTTADANDVSPGNGVCETAPGNGVCTLRAAIQESNAVPGFPPVQINLPSGTYVLTLGQLGITDSLSPCQR